MKIFCVAILSAVLLLTHPIHSYRSPWHRETEQDQNNVENRSEQSETSSGSAGMTNIGTQIEEPAEHEEVIPTAMTRLGRIQLFPNPIQRRNRATNVRNTDINQAASSRSTRNHQVQARASSRSNQMRSIATNGTNATENIQSIAATPRLRNGSSRTHNNQHRSVGTDTDELFHPYTQGDDRPD